MPTGPETRTYVIVAQHVVSDFWKDCPNMNGGAIVYRPEVRNGVAIVPELVCIHCSSVLEIKERGLQ